MSLPRTLSRQTRRLQGAPENFFGDEDADSDRDFLSAQDRVQRTLDELREMGASDEQIDSINTYESDGPFNEDLARHQNDNTQAAFFKDEVVLDGQDEVWVYNAHFVSDLD